MSWLIEVGQELRTARLAHGLTQVDLAKRAGIGRSTIARLETGRLPELGTGALRRLLQTVGLDLRVTAYNRGRPTLDELIQDNEQSEHPA